MVPKSSRIERLLHWIQNCLQKHRSYAKRTELKRDSYKQGKDELTDALSESY